MRLPGLRLLLACCALQSAAVLPIRPVSGRTGLVHARSIGRFDGACFAEGAAGENDFFGRRVDSPALAAAGASANGARRVSGASPEVSPAAPSPADILHPIRKAPYLMYAGVNTQMKVLWQLVSTDTCRIDWGTDTLYTLGSAETFEYGTDHQHSYTIGGLTPAADYFYRVIAEADTVAGLFRAAPPEGATSIGFLAYGDTRTYPSDHDSVAAGIISTYIADPSLKTILVCVGDLVSNGDVESAWDTEFFDSSYTRIRAMLANLPYQSCRGNHEGTAALFSKYFPYPFVNPRYWSFDYGPAHFAVIDQYVDYSPGSAQHTWLENDLSTTTKPWRFIVLHQPGWSAGGHGNDTNVQSYLQPLCVTYNVSIVFAGHNHYYSRADVSGVQHVTTGGGGAPLHTPNPSFPNIVAVAKRHHFCEIKIEGPFLDFAAVSAAGDTLDQFTLTETLVGVDKPGVPDRGLSQNAPNPFSGRTRIAFTLSEKGRVRLRVFDAKGRLVRVLVDEVRRPQRYVESWDGRDGQGRRVPSGTYFYELETPGRETVRKMMLVK